MEKLNQVKFCSGYGMYHTEKKRPYTSITLKEIEAMLRSPPSGAKDQAQWVIFSTLLKRVAIEQRKQGQFYALWADIDEAEGLPLLDLSCIVDDLLEGREAWVYTSRSATDENQKARIIIPLAGLVCGDDFEAYQRILNDKLNDAGVIPDRKTETANQICYLPNKGAFYEYHLTGNGLFDVKTWSTEYRAIQDEKEIVEIERKRRIEEAKQKAMQRMETGQCSPIDAYNAEYPVELLLETFGYSRRGKRWLSPNSESGSAGVTVKETKWISTHGSDIALGVGAKKDSGTCWGDAFDLFTFYMHNNDRNAAIKAAGEMFMVNGVSMTLQNQRSYMQSNEQANVKKDFKKLDELEITDLVELPDFPSTLMDLPYQLGEIQSYVFGRMTYPSVATAGVTALAILTAFAQSNIIIKSRDGLGLNEYYLTMAPTGFGKEDLRKPFSILNRLSSDGFSDDVEFVYAAPSSAQGLHRILEETPSVMALSDEFADWMALQNKNPTIRATVAYLMQIYTKALSTIHPGNAVTNKYEKVENPRLSVFATSTAEAMFETMTKEQAESGTHNRWVHFVGETELPIKRYDGLVYDPDDNLVEYIKWVKQQQDKEIVFSAAGYRRYKELDQSLAEPVKRVDGLLGGRLSEQAIKMAGLIALSDRRFEISQSDIEQGFDIRIGLYKRMKALIDAEGVMNNLHVTAAAKEQLEKQFQKKPYLYKSQLPRVSRKFEKLSVFERKIVIEALVNDGVCVQSESNLRVLKSLVHEEEC